jgi:hypothetical protein
MVGALFCLLLFLTVSCDKQERIEPSGFETELASDSIVFAVIGDYGLAGENEAQVARMVKNWDPDFIITTGDNNYDDGKFSTIVENISAYYGDYIYNYDAPEQYRCYGAAFSDKVNRFFPSPGNHDAGNFNGLTPYLNFFTLPQREEYYSFTWGPVQFFSLNSLAKDLAEQEEWLYQELAGNETPFTIVYFHHSPYSNGPHGNSEKMQWDFSGNGVDVVMTGHDHIYSVITRQNEPDLYYVINGIGGKSLYSCDESTLSSEEQNVYCIDSDYGAIRATATANQLVLELFLVGDRYFPAHRLIIDK